MNQISVKKMVSHTRKLWNTPPMDRLSYFQYVTVLHDTPEGTDEMEAMRALALKQLQTYKRIRMPKSDENLHSDDVNLLADEASEVDTAIYLKPEDIPVLENKFPKLPYQKVTMDTWPSQATALERMNTPESEKCCLDIWCRFEKQHPNKLSTDDAVDILIDKQHRLHSAEMRLLNAYMLKDNIERSIQKYKDKLDKFCDSHKIDKAKIVETKKMVDYGVELRAFPPQNYVEGGHNWRYVTVLKETSIGEHICDAMLKMSYAETRFIEAHQHIMPEELRRLANALSTKLKIIEQTEFELHGAESNVKMIKGSVKFHEKEIIEFCEHYNYFAEKM